MARLPWLIGTQFFEFLANESKYLEILLEIFFLFYHRGDSAEYTQRTIILKTSLIYHHLPPDMVL